MSEPLLHRFNLLERIIHWVVGVTYVALLLTGLAFAYPPLFWLTAPLGGGAMARVLHPYIGALFGVAMLLMVVLWIRDMFLNRLDVQWMAAVHHYATHQRDKVPPAGKYNAGQKLFFWVQGVLAIVFVATGVMLWFPEQFAPARTLLSSARLLHYIATLGGGLFLVLHVYLGTVAYPGTARSMIDGKVTRQWARLHHPRWHEEQTGLTDT
ncbi:MAG: formate dehydrogenase subunit gamma [Acidobacteria bacterium]|nr:formate dehydrogenase subunit gamma [Acidobacteriota bacterium]MYI74288.1 formate dehydrogenase subunit gamma [Acidobacteriota bacterium]